jgi:hypothetical protein
LEQQDFNLRPLVPNVIRSRTTLENSAIPADKAPGTPRRTAVTIDGQWRIEFHSEPSQEVGTAQGQ